jgi:threonyl-tRNA synthetase
MNEYLMLLRGDNSNIARLLFIPKPFISRWKGFWARSQSAVTLRPAVLGWCVRTRVSPRRTLAVFRGSAVSSSSGGQSSDASRKSSLVTNGTEKAQKPIELPTNEQSPRLLRIRHTCAHVMAMAVQRLFPEAKVTIGPWIESGFYYDFDIQRTFSPQDLEKIKKTMDEIIRADLPLKCSALSREQARMRIEQLREPYKLEILDSITEEPITIYSIGDEWWDLCAGPHVGRTGEIDPNAVQLEGVAGAYWRGDESKPMLQRIYGTAWETPEQLQEYLRRREEAKRRDHRVLGERLGLFSIQQDLAGPGLVFWHPKGAFIRNLIETFWKEAHLADGYQLLYTPHLSDRELFRVSGHVDFYAESMFKPIECEAREIIAKPMNCPHHVLVYKSRLRSYRELPIRFAELGTVYRYERSGTLHGLMRVRGFTQDDAHIFCTFEQLRIEIKRVLDLTETILTRFGFHDYQVHLSTRPSVSIGSDDAWTRSEEALRSALEDKKWPYTIDQGEGAFYGAKIDLKVRDAIGRLWQCSTIQCDFNLPERFDLEYVASDGSRARPVMVHRAIFGSLERFFGILIENCAGDFPLWLAPVQLRLLPVSEKFLPFCEQVVEKAQRRRLRAEIDLSSNRLGKKVLNAEEEHIPYMAVVGNREVDANALAVRSRHSGDLGSLAVDELLARLECEASMQL